MGIGGGGYDAFETRSERSSFGEPTDRESGETVKGANANAILVRKKLALVFVVLISVAVVLAILAAYLLKPRWVGEGDWAACAKIARFAPGDAAEAAARREGVNLWDYRAHVRPAYLNATGFTFDLTCSGGLATTPMGVRLPAGTSDGQDHYAWEVTLSEEWGLHSPGPMYLDWDTGACVFRYDGC